MILCLAKCSNIGKDTSQRQTNGAPTSGPYVQPAMPRIGEVSEHLIVICPNTYRILISGGLMTDIIKHLQDNDLWQSNGGSDAKKFKSDLVNFCPTVR
jgi:hypothetical protein